jgi:hypothetical protein
MSFIERIVLTVFAKRIFALEERQDAIEAWAKKQASPAIKQLQKQRLHVGIDHAKEGSLNVESKEDSESFLQLLELLKLGKK